MNKVGSEDRGFTTGMVVPPDGGFGWVIVAVCFIGCVFLDGITFSFSLFRIPIAEDFKIDEAEMLVMAGIFLGTFYIGGKIKILSSIYRHYIYLIYSRIGKYSLIFFKLKLYEFHWCMFFYIQSFTIIYVYILTLISLDSAK